MPGSLVGSAASLCLVTVMAPVRVITGTNVPSALNKIPQVTSVALSYSGDLPIGKWVSMVDVTLNNYNPCLVYDSAFPGLHAGAMDDTTHSGVMLDVSGTRTLQVPQTQLLNENKTYAVCYAMTDGSLSDATWRDSYLRVRISKLQSVASHAVTTITWGQLANVGDLALEYAGSVSSGKRVALVHASLNGSFPCSEPANPEAPADAMHSGPIRAAPGNKVLTFSTSQLSTVVTFAVCYTEAEGAGSIWWDSALRLRIAELTSIEYGIFSPRVMRSTNVMPATNRLPQVADTSIMYHGALPATHWLSFVQVGFNQENPCVAGNVAAAAADNAHSGRTYDNSGVPPITPGVGPILLP